LRAYTIFCPVFFQLIFLSLPVVAAAVVVLRVTPVAVVVQVVIAHQQELLAVALQPNLLYQLLRDLITQ
jgi:hypothetical protein